MQRISGIHQMKQELLDLFFEAHRRLKTADGYECSKPILERWIGLGTEAAYHPALQEGLMVFHDKQNPPPRCMGWLCLTESGLKILRKVQREHKEHLDCLCDPKRFENQYMLLGGFTK